VENLNKGNHGRSQQAGDFAEGLRTTLEGFRSQGLSQRAMVEELNKLGARTSSGKEWKLMSLQRVLKRIQVKR
jgi:hypothetical protein